MLESRIRILTRMDWRRCVNELADPRKDPTVFVSGLEIAVVGTYERVNFEGLARLGRTQPQRGDSQLLLTPDWLP